MQFFPAMNAVCYIGTWEGRGNAFPRNIAYVFFVLKYYFLHALGTSSLVEVLDYE